MNWFNTVISVILFFILVAIYNLPKHIYSELEEKFKQKGNKQLQIESYFRQLSGSKQEELLSKWTNFLTDMDKTTQKYTKNTPESKKMFRSLMHDTVMYASTKTIKYLGDFKNDIGKDENEDDQIGTVYMAAIICSLREDFTGYKTNPLDLLKITIQDFDDYKERYTKIWEEIKK